MYSVHDPAKRGVAPFGYLGIKVCSRLPQAFRSVPRPSSPPSAKASTRCPSLAQSLQQQRLPAPVAKPRTGPIQQVSGVNHTSAREDQRRHNQPCQIDLFTHTFPHPRTQQNTPAPHPARSERNLSIPRLAPTELSRTSKDATEPDSQSTKNKATLATG
jgi:hypothetical protein